MKFLSEYLPQPIVKAIGWTLLHSLWQGLLIALVLVLLLIILKRRTASVRYFLSVTALFTFLAITALTFISQYSQAINLQASPPAASSKIYASGFPIELTIRQASSGSVPGWSWANMASIFNDYFYQHIPLIVLLWSLGVSICMLRFIGGYAYTQRLKHYKTSALPEYWQNTLHQLAARAGIKQKVCLLESALVKVPMVIGHLKPFVLLPIGTITGLPTEQVEAILAHELAHIYRKDYLINIFQSLVEIVFFFHPAIWWISSKIREEREHCCDDIALNLCGSSLTFAKALANLEHFYTAAPAIAVGFTGNGKHLLTRIQRLIHEPRRTPNFAEGFLAACVVMISLTAITVSAGSNMSNGQTKLSAGVLAHAGHNGPSLSGITADADTTTNTFTFNGTKNGKRYNIKATMQRGTIVTLFVNGKEIPDSQKSEYYDLIYSLMEDVPASPTPAEAPVRIDPGFPVEPVPAPEAPDAEQHLSAFPEPAPAVPAPAAPESITTEPEPPMPAIAPMPAGSIAEIIRAALLGDTANMRKGDFVYQFTGKQDKNYKITIKDGVLTELKVNGKKIPKAEYANYLYIPEEIEENSPSKHMGFGTLQDQLYKLEEEKERMARKNEALLERHAREFKVLQERMQAQEETLRESKEDMQRKSQQFHKEAMREYEKATAKHDESVKFSKQLISLINDQLEKDKLLNGKENPYIQLNTEGLFIDKVKQPKSTFKKYKALIEKKTGKPLDFMIQYNYKEQERSEQKYDSGMGRHYEAMETQNDLMKLLHAQLLKENLLKNDEEYHIRISPQGLYIDGEKQPAEVFNRYTEFIEKKTGKPFVYTFEYSSTVGK